jgi:hypothetical protein
MIFLLLIIVTCYHYLLLVVTYYLLIPLHITLTLVLESTSNIVTNNLLPWLLQRGRCSNVTALMAAPPVAATPL